MTQRGINESILTCTLFGRHFELRTKTNFPNAYFWELVGEIFAGWAFTIFAELQKQRQKYKAFNSSAKISGLTGWQSVCYGNLMSILFPCLNILGRSIQDVHKNDKRQQREENDYSKWIKIERARTWKER